MAAPIRRRLDVLEGSGEYDHRGPFVVIARTGHEPVGVGAPHPSRLDVLRGADETWDELAARVAAKFQNLPLMVVYMPANGRE